VARQPTSEQITLVKTILPSDAATFGWDDAKITEILVSLDLSTTRTVRTFWQERVSNTVRYHDKGVALGSVDNLKQVHDNYVAMLAYWDSLLAKEESVSRPMSFGEIEGPRG
jgi:hypothetical protein